MPRTALSWVHYVPPVGYSMRGKCVCSAPADRDSRSSTGKRTCMATGDACVQGTLLSQYGHSLSGGCSVVPRNIAVLKPWLLESTRGPGPRTCYPGYQYASSVCGEDSSAGKGVSGQPCRVCPLWTRQAALATPMASHRPPGLRLRPTPLTAAPEWTSRPTHIRRRYSTPRSGGGRKEAQTTRHPTLSRSFRVLPLTWHPCRRSQEIS